MSVFIGAVSDDDVFIIDKIQLLRRVGYGVYIDEDRWGNPRVAITFPKKPHTYHWFRVLNNAHLGSKYKGYLVYMQSYNAGSGKSRKGVKEGMRVRERVINEIKKLI